jgi:SAM-dependent methyltransferase
VGDPAERSTDARPVAPAVIWHDLECGLYRADLPLWLELARACPDGPILDVGAGAGRVALALARSGRHVIALDHDRRLLDALAQRAGDLPVETVCADARSFALPERGALALCIVPMQTLQLLGGRAGRRDFLRLARAHLKPGGLLACALVTELEPFDCSDGGEAPSPETALIDGVRYVSQATRVEVAAGSIAIERERRIVAPAAAERAGAAPATAGYPTASAASSAPGASDAAAAERDLIELDRLSAVELEREGVAAGLLVEPCRRVAPTADHTGSTVVVLRV